MDIFKKTISSDPYFQEREREYKEYIQRERKRKIQNFFVLLVFAIVFHGLFIFFISITFGNYLKENSGFLFNIVIFILVVVYIVAMIFFVKLLEKKGLLKSGNDDPYS